LFAMVLDLWSGVAQYANSQESKDGESDKVGRQEERPIDIRM